MAISKSRHSRGAPSCVRGRNSDHTDKDVRERPVRDEVDVRTVENGRESRPERAVQAAERKAYYWWNKWKEQKEHVDLMQTHWAENEQKGNLAARLSRKLAQSEQERVRLQLRLRISESACQEARNQLQDTRNQLRVSELERQRAESQLKDARNEPSLADWSTDLNHVKQQVLNSVQVCVHRTLPNDLVRGAGIVTKMDETVRSRLFGWLEDGVPLGDKRDPVAILKATNALYDEVVQIDFVIREELEHELKANLARIFLQAVNLWSRVSQ